MGEWEYEYRFSFEFLQAMIFIFFCLNQPNKKKIEGRGMKMEQ